jgi:hypothetical protein
MNSRKHIPSALIGLALIATPITAMAMDHGRYLSDSSLRRQTVTAYNQASDSHVVAIDWDDHHRGEHHGNHEGWERNRGDRYGYNRSPYYARGYGYRSGRRYAPGSCAQLQHQAQLDRQRGHPEAAEDLMNKVRNRCR